MERSHDESERIDSWYRALHEGRLTVEQLAVLARMIEDGQAADLQGAAAILDWQESIINPDEHMYGF